MNPEQEKAFEREWAMHCSEYPLSGGYGLYARAMFAAGLTCAEQQNKLARGLALVAAAQVCRNESKAYERTALECRHRGNITGDGFDSASSMACASIAEKILDLLSADAAKTLEAHDKEVAAQATAPLVEALKGSVIALDDWLNIHAAHHCDEKRVAEAEARVHECGTIAYIADVQQKNEAALSTHRAGQDAQKGYTSTWQSLC